jgi:protein AATF/BFR2
MQKLLTTTNQLPSHETFSNHTENEEVQGALVEAQQSMRGLLDTMVDIRLELIKRHPEIDSSTLPPNRKRIRDTVDLDAVWSQLTHLSTTFSTYRQGAIERWSSKAQLTSAALSQKKFKAINQGLQAQIDAILADRDRLLKRTRQKRGDYTILDADSNLEHSDELFDDTDFYQQLLRELISSRTSQTDDLNDASQFASLRHLAQSNKKKPVDNKASKGRKLRYNVHEKLLNFMAPVPAGTWHDEMTAELYTSFLGASKTPLAVSQSLDGLELFG